MPDIDTPLWLASWSVVVAYRPEEALDMNRPARGEAVEGFGGHCGELPELHAVRLHSLAGDAGSNAQGLALPPGCARHSD